MSESKKSGEFILNNLQIFSEAVFFFENSIRPKINNGIDNFIKNFSNENNWDGNFQLEENDNIWLRPKTWEKEDGLEAWFAIESTKSDDDDNYWISLFCKKAINNCEAGFFFDVDHKHFGGKHAWKAHIRSIPEELDTRLKEIGFKQLDIRFFLPIELDNEALAKSWLKENPFTPDDECFAPLRDTLEKLKQSVPIFEAIMDSALASQYS